MILETKNRKIILNLSTRKIVNVANILKGKNFEDIYFKAINENDLDSLSKIIYVFADTEDGLKAFKSSDEVYDFIDDYKEENKKTYQDIFEEIAKVINDEGFFKRKMSKKELEERISNPISGMNMNEIIKTSTEKAVTKIAEQEVFQGYMG